MRAAFPTQLILLELIIEIFEGKSNLRNSSDFKII
jgi:hypothetical protein